MSCTGSRYCLTNSSHKFAQKLAAFTAYNGNLLNTPDIIRYSRESLEGRDVYTRSKIWGKHDYGGSVAAKLIELYAPWTVFEHIGRVLSKSSSGALDHVRLDFGAY